MKILKNHPAAKGISGSSGIFFVSSRHVECVVRIERMQPDIKAFEVF